jgi:DMSO/TMAO reductase YedYZ molybdopterin-dependent catalytic subunit
MKKHYLIKVVRMFFCVMFIWVALEYSENIALADSKGLKGFPDNAVTREALQVQNRGCNSCHGKSMTNNLEKFKDGEPKLHIMAKTGYGKPEEIGHCLNCHQGFPLAGPKLAATIHTMHYKEKTAFQGDCFSCHHIDNKGNYVMWDDIKYELEVYGYSGYDSKDIRPVLDKWAKERGFNKGNQLGFTMDSALKGDMTFSQDVITPVKDIFAMRNFGTPPPMKPEDYLLTIKGLVNKETKYTLNQLKNRKQADSYLTHMCGSVKPGTPQIANLKWSGVPLKGVLEEVGVKKGADALYIHCYDGWEYTVPLVRALNPRSLLALKVNDEELSDWEGGPVRLVPMGGLGWELGLRIKSIELIDAKKQKQVPLAIAGASPEEPWQQGIGPNSGFLAPDSGTRVNQGDPVIIEGWAFAKGGIDTSPISKIYISGDYGTKWRAFPVKPGDPERWQYWKFNWQPPGKGTYLLKVKTIDLKGRMQPTKSSYPFMPEPQLPANLVITVE